MKYLYVTGSILLIIAVFSVVGGYIWFQQQLSASAGGVGDTVNVEIAPGMSSAQIADRLEQEGLINDALAFRILARISNSSGSIQAGFYQIATNLPAEDVLAQITEGQVAQKIILIPGGVTLMDITEVLKESGFSETDVARALAAQYDFSVLTDKPPRAGLEGYLYPDTYHIGADATAGELISMVLANTDAKISEAMRKQWRSKGLNIHEGLTLASIVQKEAHETREQRQIAQVFLTRLKTSRKLEADPTYLYGARISGRSGSPGLDSPYNTYKIPGLPPGPIANVEAGALQAVASPAGTDYLYFVTGEDGVTRFSKDKEQHLRYIDEFGISQ